MSPKKIIVVKGSSKDKEGLLASRLKDLRTHFNHVETKEMAEDPAWPYTAASLKDRLKIVRDALTDSTCDVVWWARGGYGASDLLPEIPWTKIKRQARKKIIVGFSDCSAIHAAMYTLCDSWSIHGPMPATTTWQQNGSEDVDELLKFLKGETDQFKLAISKQVNAKSKAPKIRGKVFGGCLSVLTNLIGTPYFPKSLRGHIIILEDIGENPGKVLRMLNQWQQAGKLKGVKALILGAFTQLSSNLETTDDLLVREIARRFDLPIFVSLALGHVSPNMPFIVGGDGYIEKQSFISMPPKKSKKNKPTKNQKVRI